MGSTALQSWGDYDESAVAEDEKQAKVSGGVYVKLEEGDNVLRFFPPRPGQKTPFAIVNQHAGKLPSGKFVRFVCPKLTNGGKCPACDYNSKMFNSPNKKDAAKAKDWRAKKRVFAIVLSREDYIIEKEGGPPAVPKIFEFGTTILENLIGLRKDSDYGNFTHPINGFDINIKRKGKTQNDTEYSVVPKRNSSRLADTDERINELIEAMPDLSGKFVVPHSNEIAVLIDELLESIGGGTPSKRKDSSEGDDDQIPF